MSFGAAAVAAAGGATGLCLTERTALFFTSRCCRYPLPTVVPASIATVVAANVAASTADTTSTASVTTCRCRRRQLMRYFVYYFLEVAYWQIVILFVRIIMVAQLVKRQVRRVAKTMMSDCSSTRCAPGKAPGIGDNPHLAVASRAP